MGKKSRNHSQVPEEERDLKNRLEETEEMLHAIRQDMVDAFVVMRENGTQIVTLNDAGFPYRMMVESMNEGAVTLIPDGDIFYVNPCFCRMMQLESKKLIGVHFQELIVPEQRERFEELFQRASLMGERSEFTLQAANQARIPVQLSIYRLGEEATSGISIIAADISERVQNEEKIRVLASELTLAEQEERHRISQILHDDLQQRLFAIRTQLSLFKINDDNDTNSAEVQSTLEQVQTWISDTINITRNLSIDMSPAVLHGEGLSEAILWLSARMKDQHGLQIKIEARDNLTPLNDHTRILLFQAVRELLFNVVKHSGIHEATVTLERTDQNGRITVADLGKGFDMGNLTNTSGRLHGLLLIKNRLRLMNGDMTIHSVPGDGTRVLIQFPMQKETI